MLMHVLLPSIGFPPGPFRGDEFWRAPRRSREWADDNHFPECAFTPGRKTSIFSIDPSAPEKIHRAGKASDAHGQAKERQ